MLSIGFGPIAITYGAQKKISHIPTHILRFITDAKLLAHISFSSISKFHTVSN